MDIDFYTGKITHGTQFTLKPYLPAAERTLSFWSLQRRQKCRTSYNG